MNAQCDVSLVDEWLQGELPEPAASDTAVHIASCPSCMREAELLRAEAKLFAQRARLQSIPALVPATRVKRRRWIPAATLAAAAGFIFLIKLTTELRPTVTAIPEDKLPAGATKESTAPKTASARPDHWSFQTSATPFVAIENVRGKIEVRSTTSSKVDVSAEYEGVPEKKEFPWRLDVRKDGERVQARLFCGVTNHATGAFACGDAPKVNLTVTVPAGSNLTIKSVSGEVEVRDVDTVDAQSVSGDVEIASRGATRKLTFKTVSGEVDLEVAGDCAKDCAIKGNTVSGDVEIKFKRSPSVAVRYHAVSGSVETTLPVKVTRSESGMGSTQYEGTLGAGEGTLDVNSVSGDLTLAQ